jgi:hypothetical protein
MWSYVRRIERLPAKRPARCSAKHGFAEARAVAEG